MMECFFEVIDYITDMLQALTCATVFVRETFGKQIHPGIFFLTLPFNNPGESLVHFSSWVAGPYLKNYFKFVYCLYKSD